MFNAATAAAVIAAAKDLDSDLVVTVTDRSGAVTAHTGTPISVNSKGVNIKIDGKVRSFGLSRIVSLIHDGDDAVDTGMDAETDAEIYAMLGDGMTTAELASHLSDALTTEMTPKELRVHLRALGLGVGKGRKYSLTATEYRMVRDLVNTVV